MPNKTLEFIDVPKTTLQKIHDHRIEDWHEDGKNLERLFEKHSEAYRKKICAKCSDEQKKSRNCYVGKGTDSNGNIKTSCMHMSRAGYRKFRKKIYEHIDFHPMFFNP